MDPEEKSGRPKRIPNPLRFFFNKEAKEGYVPNRELFAYSAALAGQNATYGIVNQWIFYFCTNVLHMRPDHVGAITSLSRVWDAVNDPIVGVIIDRRNYKPGQKLHPFLGKLPIVIGILSALLFCNFGLGETGSIAVFLCIYLVWDLTYSFQDTALWGTMSLISPHSEERGRVSQWLNIGVGAGGGIVGIISLLMGIGEKEGISLSTQFLCYGLVFGFGGELLSSLAAKTKERVEYVKEKRLQSFWQDLADLRHNKILILLLLAQVVSFFDGAIPQIYFFEYCTSYQIGSIEINGQTAQFLYGLLINIFGALSMFFATKVAEKLGGMRNVIILAKVTNIVTRCIAFFIGYQTLGQMAAVMAFMSIGAIPNNMVGIAQRSILCDSVDYVEWKTGKRTEGISFSMQNLTNKLLDSIKLYFCGRVLDYLRFDGELTVDQLRKVSPQYFKAQWPLFMLLPALGSLLYLIPFLCIRYSKQQKAQVEQELIQRHEQEERAKEDAIEP
ncbi:MAG TPA: MFS transporter [Candidatus Fimivicinus intestinavium]|nr:MFS transporter [Candidatus Fimivicinus intestinavium]